jgi:small subunit ribosomal protein S9
LSSSKASGDGSSSDDSDDSSDEAPEDLKITEDMYILPDEKDITFKAGVATPDVELSPEEEEEALEARKRYYARKVSGIADEEVVAPAKVYVPLREKKIDDLGRAYGTGKRKTSIARVWVKDGSGIFEINGRRLIDYFTPIPRETCLGAFIASKTVGLFDVFCTVKGGGISGKKSIFSCDYHSVLNMKCTCSNNAMNIFQANPVRSDLA